MLVLSRKKDETIFIGDQIEVTVIEVRGNSVKLGLKAPRNVGIRRGELPATAHQSQPAFDTTQDLSASPLFTVEVFTG